MEYVRANVTSRYSTTSVVDSTYVAHPDLSMNVDRDALRPPLVLIDMIDDLNEGEVLIIWKESLR